MKMAIGVVVRVMAWIIRDVTNRISMKIDISQIKCSHDAASLNMCANALCIAYPFT